MAVKPQKNLSKHQDMAKDMVANKDPKAPHMADVLQPNSADYHPQPGDAVTTPGNQGENAYGIGFGNVGSSDGKPK